MDEFHGCDDVVRRRLPDIPVACFRPQALETAARWFTTQLPGRVLYAVKANPAPYVIKGLWEAGVRAFDVASVPEIQLVRAVAPEAFLAFMHPVKSREAIEQAYFDYGVRHFAFDCADELKKILSVTGSPRDLGLILRLAVPGMASEHPLSGKFGADPLYAGALLKTARRVARQVGISFHVGSQTMDPRAYISALSQVESVLRAIPRTKVDIIDIGGGFPSMYPGLMPPPMDDYKSAIEQGLKNLPRAGEYEIWSEPGRALVAESTSVVVRVNMRRDDALYINDGTYGSLFDAAAHLGLRYPVRLIRPGGGGSRKTALKAFRFYGPTCDSIDHMPGPFLLPEDMREGDYIEIGQLGAYGNTMRTNFNGFAPHETVIVEAPPLATMYDDSAVPALPELCTA